MINELLKEELQEVRNIQFDLKQLKTGKKCLKCQKHKRKAVSKRPNKTTQPYCTILGAVGQ